MKSTKIKQVQGQASLKNFFKPKNQPVQEDTQLAIKENVITPSNKQIDVKVEDEQIDQNQVDNDFNSKQNPEIEQLNIDNYENSLDVLQRREEYIKKKLSPFKYSKRKSFKSKVKNKKVKDERSLSPVNKKRSKQQLKWLRQTLSSKKKVKIEDEDMELIEQKLASIYKQERLSQIQFTPKEDNSKQNQMEVLEEQQYPIAVVSQFDSRQENMSNNSSKRSEWSKGSKSDGRTNRQLQINDFRQFNSTLSSNKKVKHSNNQTQTEVDKINNNKMIAEQEQGNTMECEKNTINLQAQANNQINENIEKNANKNNQDIQQEQQEQQIIPPKVSQQKKMKNLLSFCIPTQNKNMIERTKQKENIAINDKVSENNINQSKDTQHEDQQTQLKNVLQKQPENKIKQPKENSTNSKLVFAKNNQKSSDENVQKQDKKFANDMENEEQQQQIEYIEEVQNKNQQIQDIGQKEIEENKQNIEAQTKENEKNAQSMFKLFILYMEQNAKDLTQNQQQSLNKLKKFKPVTRISYEKQIKEYKFSEQYDVFIVQYEKVQELKIQFCDFIEFMKIPKKKKNEIYKKINQFYKQFTFNKEEFEKSMKQNLDLYYSRFLKFISAPSNDQDEKQKEKQEVQKIEMKGKDSYRVISYKTQWDQQIEIRPTEEQLDVIVSDIKKDTKIIACAGSGKTTTLVIRLKYLLDHGVKPNQIIISTFNIEAGKHISQKVYEMIGKEVQQSIIIGNIDKIAYKFIRSELEAKQKNSSSVLLFSQREYCDIWLAHIKKYKFQYLQYKYFFFDEFQDVSELQYQILMEFKNLNCILTVIGDDAQNIYGFRDTKIDIIQNRINEDLKKKKKELQEFKLTANYRSTHLITKFANKILEKNENLIKKTMQSAMEIHGESEAERMKSKYDKEDDYPYLHIFDSEKQQNESIIKRILSLVRHKGFQFKDIAIIGPMNDQLKKFEEVVEKHNQKSIQSDQIPYQAFITLKFEDFKLVEFNSAPQKQNKLTISTIHRSKGLEWDIVYFLGCNDDQFPMAFVQKNKSQACVILEEQRRLFYVGATRAIKELNFCCIIKEPERMNEKDKTLGKYKVSRFFADIPREYFRADIMLDFQEHIMSGYKWIEFDQLGNDEEQFSIKIREVISKMNSKQLEDINAFTQNIVQEKTVKSLYMDKHEISQQVKDNQLFTEMGMFFDRCIVRMIGEKYNAKNSFYNQVAAQVILPQIYDLHLPENLFRLFLRYSKFFTTFDSAQLDDSRNVIERFRNEGDREKSEQEILDMQELHSILSYNAEIQCLKKIQIFNFQKHKSNRYFQDQFERLGQSYIIALSEYMNKHKKSEEIYENIYKISKCGFLFENRRKYLYNNNLNTILDFELLKNIQVNFINGYLSQYQSLECKKIYKTKNIQGLIDLIANQNHLIFFKFDIFETYKKEDFLNYLFAAAYMQVVDKITIEQISIFNFLTGVIQSIDLTAWDKQESYFNQIEQIAKAQILQNVENNIMKIIDQEQDQVLNQQQKEELKKLIFSNISPQELQENIQNIRSGSTSVNKNEMLAEQNEEIGQDLHQIDQNDNQQPNGTVMVEEKEQIVNSEQKDKNEIINKNNISHSKQQIESYEPLRKKIQFEELNHPAILFNDMQVEYQNSFINNQFQYEENENDFNNSNQSNIKDNNKMQDENLINYHLQEQFPQQIEQNQIKKLSAQKQQTNMIQTEFKSSIQHLKDQQLKEQLTIDVDKFKRLHQKYNSIQQETLYDAQKDKQELIDQKQINKNNIIGQQQVQIQPQQIQEKKKQFYKETSSNHFNKQANQKQQEQNHCKSQSFDADYDIQEDNSALSKPEFQKIHQSSSYPEYEEDDISNIQSQEEEDTNYSYAHNFEKQTKHNQNRASNINKKNLMKKSPNSKYNQQKEVKIKPGNVIPTHKMNQQQFKKVNLSNYIEILNAYEEEDIDSDQDDSDDQIMIQRFRQIQGQQKKKY